MKVTIKQLNEARRGLSTLLVVPVKSALVGYRVQNNLRKIENELKTYDEVVGELNTEYAERDGNGKLVMYSETTIKLKEKTKDEYHKKIKELQDEKVTIGIKLFTLDDLETFCEHDALTPAVLYLLEWMIKDGE